ncbi:MAG: amino acid adenylation domain-containing protein [Candidatus Omnitrophota bacterium]
MNVVELISHYGDLGVTFRVVDNNLNIGAPRGKLTPGQISELRRHKDEIVKFLNDHHKKQENNRSIEPAEEKEYYTLSPGQKRLFIVSLFDKGGIGYNMPFVLILEGKLNNARMENIFHRLVQRHESFRTSFEMQHDEPVQRIHQTVPFAIEYYTQTGTPEETIHAFVKPFDLSQAPLVRVGLIKIEDETHILGVDMHHIISDGTSMGIFMREFMALYGGSELAEPRLRYRDYSEWVQQDKQVESIKKQEDYWLDVFAGDIPQLNLPLDYLRPTIQAFDGRQILFFIDKEEMDRLKALALKEHATLFIVMFSIYNVLLSRLSGQEDIIVGTPAAGRGHDDLQGVIGMFVNTLALRNFPTGKKTFREFMLEVKDRTLAAFSNQDYPYEGLVEKVVKEREPGRNPLFDSMFAFQNVDIPEIEIQGIQLKHFVREEQAAKFDLLIEFMEERNRLSFLFKYDTKLFRKETIIRFSEYFKRMVSTVANDNDIVLSNIDMMTEAEKQRVLFDFNHTASDYPRDKTIHELFRDQVERTPDRIAVIDSSSHGLSYRELDERSNRLANELIRKGIEPDMIVGIKIARSMEMIAGILGILKSGAAYLPIEIDYPQERIDYMLKDSRAALLVKANNEEDEKVRSLEDQKVLFLDPLTLLPSYPLNFSLLPATVNRQPATSLAYVIYTSGSTGKPKGVLTMHSNVTRVVKNTNYIEFGAEDRVLQLSNYAFDGSVFDIYGALLNGSALVLIDRQTVLAVDRLAHRIRHEHVTVFFVTTALFNILVELEKESLVHVRKILFGGERVSVEHSRKALAFLGKGKILHVYGPTETTVYATYYPIDAIDDQAATIPIGRPLANTTIYILDKHLNPVPVGIGGELYIGGEGTARGYLNNPELTNDKFVTPTKNTQTKSFCPAFYKKRAAGGILYKTGDLGRWLDDGTIEFLGRIDHQVKLRGFRIELGEIESELLKYNGIKEALVLIKENKRNENTQETDRYLCAYVVSGSELNRPELRECLSRRLPEYMIPSYFIRLEKFPLTSNGKIDMKQLPDIAIDNIDNEDEYVAPRNETEDILAEIWSEVLEIDKSKIGIDSDFFHLGGHSLKAVLIAAKIRKRFNFDISIMEIFKTPTIRGIASLFKAIQLACNQEIPINEDTEEVVL